MVKNVIKDYGVVIQGHSKELKLQKILNDSKENRIALVSYKDGMPLNNYDFTKAEAITLKRLLEKEIGYTTPTVTSAKPEEEEKEFGTKSPSVTENEDIIKKLCMLPANDINFHTAVKEATHAELTKAIAWMKGDKGRHGTRIKYCEIAVRKREAMQNTTPKTTTSTPTPAPKEEAKILTFPTADKKPMFIQLKTEGNATYEECAEKLEKEKEMWKDTDSQYVIDGLMELAKVDQDFRNNIMREDKTYAGFMEYMYKAAQNGYCIKYGKNMGWIDRDTGLGLAIDYYNNDDEKVEEEEKKRREEEAEKRKAEAEAKSKTTKTTKRGVKKNDKNIGKIKKRVNA